MQGLHCTELEIVDKVLERKKQYHGPDVSVLQYKRSFWNILQFVTCHLKICTVTDVHMNSLILLFSKNV